MIRPARADIVFLQPGCDTLAGDPPVHLAMSGAGIAARDAVVIGECVRRQLPVVMVQEGYSAQAGRVQCVGIARTIRTYGCDDRAPVGGPEKAAKTSAGGAGGMGKEAPAGAE